MDTEILKNQNKICEKYGVTFYGSPDNLKLGISLNIKEHIFPINGLRINPEGDTTGWYIWAGREEPLLDEDFFKPIHIIHLVELCPEVVPYLGLPPGWRFLIAPNHEDVWFDKNLLEII